MDTNVSDVSEFVLLEPDAVEPTDRISTGQPPTIWTASWEEWKQLYDSVRPTLVQLFWEMGEELFLATPNSSFLNF